MLNYSSESSEHLNVRLALAICDRRSSFNKFPSVGIVAALIFRGSKRTSFPHASSSVSIRTRLLRLDLELEITSSRAIISNDDSNKRNSIEAERTVGCRLSGRMSISRTVIRTDCYQLLIEFSVTGRTDHVYATIDDGQASLPCDLRFYEASVIEEVVWSRHSKVGKSPRIIFWDIGRSFSPWELPESKSFA